MLLGEKIRYSADWLLKEKPEKLEGVEFVSLEEPNYFISVNGVDIFANEYKMAYAGGSVIMKFYNNGKYVASVTVCGRSEYKEDEFLIIEYNNIISETSVRTINMRLADDKTVKEYTLK